MIDNLASSLRTGYRRNYRAHWRRSHLRVMFPRSCAEIRQTLPDEAEVEKDGWG